jgi:histidinol-phosphate aminotransferase
MLPYVPPTSSRQGLLRLDFNENTLGCSPRVLRAIEQYLNPEFPTIYPEYEDARNRMGAFFGVPGDRLVFCDGTDEAIALIAHTYVDPGDEVVVAWPTFPIFRLYTELAGGVLRMVSYREPDLDYPLEEVLDAISPRTRAVMVANPNNPTAGAIGLREIEAILKRAPRAAVLIDEAYFDFHGVTALGLLDRYANLFVSRTFSKAYGLAGLRVGCLISHPEAIAACHKGQSPYSVNSLGIVCALEAVEDHEYIENYVREVFAARELLLAGLDRLGVPYYPTHSNFVLTKMGERAKAVCKGMRERGILVRDRTHEIAGAVRITVGTRPQIERALGALEKVLRP